MSNSSGKKHILAINESEDVLQLFTDLLEDEGFRVTTQKYVIKDLEAICKMRPDLIILDYMWELEDDGWSLLQMLKMNPSTAAIPIVLCTGAVHRVEELGPHLQQMGVRVVLKPFNITELLDEITTALGSNDALADKE